MGVQVAGECYETQALANDAFYSSQHASSSGLDALTGMFVSYYKSGLIWNQKIEVYDLAGGYPITTNIVPQANVGTSCTVSYTPIASTQDGLVMGWLVVAAMVAAYSIHLLRRSLT